jgi:hypothetical protein
MVQNRVKTRRPACAANDQPCSSGLPSGTALPLQNGASVAALLLTTNTLVAEEQTPWGGSPALMTEFGPLDEACISRRLTPARRSHSGSALRLAEAGAWRPGRRADILRPRC